MCVAARGACGARHVRAIDQGSSDWSARTRYARYSTIDWSTLACCARVQRSPMQIFFFCIMGRM